LGAYDAVRNRLKAANPSGDFEKFWRKTLNDGVVANTAYSPLSVTPKFNAASLPAIPPPNPGELEFLFRPDPTIHDGRFANNGWLQELPKPVTKLVWDNAALFGPKTSWNLGVTHTVAARGGEHGQIVSTVVDIALSNSKVTAAGWIVPGQAEGVVVLPLGYGRKKSRLHRHEQRFQRVCGANVQCALASHSRRRVGQENRAGVFAGLHAISLQYGRAQDS